MVDNFRIVLVDDHTLLRECYRALLEQTDDLVVVGESSDGHHALRVVTETMPDLVLMDLSMPGMHGVDATREIKRRHPRVKVLVFTEDKLDEYLRESLRAGANGYLLKDVGQAEFFTAIRSVLAGSTYISPELPHRQSDDTAGDSTGVRCVWDAVTRRQRQIMKLVAEGHSSRDIAAYLSISVKTVEKHRSNLMKRLGLRKACNVTSFAIGWGLVGAGASYAEPNG